MCGRVKNGKLMAKKGQKGKTHFVKSRTNSDSSDSNLEYSSVGSGALHSNYLRVMTLNLHNVNFQSLGRLVQY